MRIVIGSDHAGFELKEHFKNTFKEFDWVDLGTHSEESVDFPDYADKVATEISADDDAVGLLICGSGQGMAMRANRYPKVRAALCWSEEVAKLTRQHNNANILCLGSRVLPVDVCEKIFKAFITTDFEGGRHQRRVDKLEGQIKC